MAPKKRVLFCCSFPCDAFYTSFIHGMHPIFIRHFFHKTFSYQKKKERKGKERNFQNFPFFCLHFFLLRRAQEKVDRDGKGEEMKK